MVHILVLFSYPNTRRIPQCVEESTLICPYQKESPDRLRLSGCSILVYVRHKHHSFIELGTREQLGGHRIRHVMQSYLSALRELGLACSESSGQAVLGVDTVDTVDSVQVLDKSNLEACSCTLAGRNR
jgi:hypothetical protein